MRRSAWHAPSSLRPSAHHRTPAREAGAARMSGRGLDRHGPGHFGHRATDANRAAGTARRIARRKPRCAGLRSPPLWPAPSLCPGPRVPRSDPTGQLSTRTGRTGPPCPTPPRTRRSRRCLMPVAPGAGRRRDVPARPCPSATARRCPSPAIRHPGLGSGPDPPTRTSRIGRAEPHAIGLRDTGAGWPGGTAPTDGIRRHPTPRERQRSRSGRMAALAATGTRGPERTRP